MRRPQLSVAAFFRHCEISLAPPPLTRHSAFASHDIVSIFWLGRSCHCRTWHVNHFFSIATVATGQNVLMNSYRVKIYISKVYFSFRFLISIYSNFQLWRQTNWNIEPCRLFYWKLEPMLSGLESTNAGVVFTNVLCSSVGRDHCVTVAVWLTPALARSGAAIALNRKMLIWMLDCWVSLIGAISEKRNPWTATADWLLLAGLWSWSTHDARLHNPH